MSNCPRCGAAKHRGRCKKAAPAVAVAPPVITLAPVALEVPSGLGFRASIEDGQLHVEQDHPDTDGTIYTHNLVLAPHEAARLVDWIADQVGTRD